MLNRGAWAAVLSFIFIFQTITLAPLISAQNSSLGFEIVEFTADDRNYQRGETVSMWVMIRNTGDIPIERSRALFKVISPSGDVVFSYAQWDNHTRNPGWLFTIASSWNIPSNADGGHHTLEVVVTVWESPEITSNHERQIRQLQNLFFVGGTITPTPLPSPTPEPTPEPPPETTPSPTPSTTDGNDSYSTATTIVIGSSYNADISSGNDVDYYSFQASSNTSYRIETSNLGSDVDTVIHLYDRNGVSEITNDDDGGNGLASKIVWSASSSGTYYVKVRPYSSSTIGPYDIIIAQESSSEVTPTDDVTPSYPGDGNDAPSVATILSIGTLNNAEINPAGDVDYYRFDASSGVTYIIETSNLGSGSDTYIHLYDRDGVTGLYSDDDSGEGYASKIEWSASSSGTYYVKVRHYHENSGTGTYTIKISGEQFTFPEVIIPQTATFVTVNNVAFSSDRKTMYMELVWDPASNIPTADFQPHTWPDITNARISVEPLNGVHMTGFFITNVRSDYSEEIGETILWAGLDVLVAPIPYGSFITRAAEIIYAIATHPNDEITKVEQGPVDAFSHDTGHFYSPTYIIQFKSDAPLDLWQIKIQASSQRMLGPNHPDPNGFYQQDVTLPFRP